MAFKDLKVNDVQRLEEGQKRLEGDVSELKRDVSKLQIGQNRVEKQIHLNNARVVVHAACRRMRSDNRRG